MPHHIRSSIPARSWLGKSFVWSLDLKPPHTDTDSRHCCDRCVLGSKMPTMTSSASSREPKTCWHKATGLRSYTPSSSKTSQQPRRSSWIWNRTWMPGAILNKQKGRVSDKGKWAEGKLPSLFCFCPKGSRFSQPERPIRNRLSESQPCV